MWSSVGNDVPVLIHENWPRRITLLLAVVSFAACAGPRSTRTEFAALPPAIVVTEKYSKGTVHFPQGTYSLERTERDGAYYRAPKKIAQRTYGAALLRDGGIFLSGRPRDKPRWFIQTAYGVRKLGGVPSRIYRAQ
jgi:hypothetical protein